MTDKQIIVGRGSAKTYTTLNTIVVMLENEKLKEALKAKEQECERLKVEAEKWESAFTLDTKLLDKEEARANKLEQQLDQLKEQLNAKEQECERLKERLKEMNEVIRTETTRCSLVNSLKTELDQLKKERKALGMAYLVTNELLQEKTKECTNLKTENEELKQKVESYNCSTNCYKYKQAEKYKQTLAGIKEIAESVSSWGSKCKICELNKNCADCLDDNMQTILQKISEVEDV